MQLRFFGTLWLICLMVACGASPEIQATSHNVLPAFTPSPVATDILIPTPTTTKSSVLATASPQTIPSPLTLLLSPAATAEVQHAAISELLAHPTCELPCWWGFTPGKSRWSEVESFSGELGLRFNVSKTPEGGFENETSFFSNQVFNWITFKEKAGIVQAITINVEGFSTPTTQTNLRRDWSAYSPRSVMAWAGVPSRVWVRSLNHAPERFGPRAPYDIWLFYDDLGVLIEYTGALTRGPIYEFCPNFSATTGNIYYLIVVLRSPESSAPLEEINDFVYNGLGGARPLDDVTNLSNQDFYQLLTDKSQYPCFTTSESAWDGWP